MTLTEFLQSRLAEDEAVAGRVSSTPRWKWALWRVRAVLLSRGPK